MHRCRKCEVKRLQKYDRSGHGKAIGRRYWLEERRFGRHGISSDDYNKMLSRQNGCCAICGDELENVKCVTCIDHDHETGKVRGLLCLLCNNGLGMFRDNPEVLMRAAEYLEGKKESKNDSN